MDGFNEKSLVSRETKCFTDIKSRYPLRNTPARSESNRVSGFVQRPNRGSLISSKLLSSLATKSLEPPFPHRNRISAIQNSEENEESLESGNNEVGAKEDVQDPESRKIVSETLLEFRRTLDKLKKSRSGSERRHYRPNLVAYDILKKKKKVSTFSNKSIGSIPGIEIGDEFECRVELVLTGLHPSRAGTVGHIFKDEKFIAISIVFYIPCELNKIAGMYDDVLVCSSQNENNSRKLERGNLALKNSAVKKNPIRVVLGFGNVKRYVYAGLYFIQKSWRKKGHDKSVYFFELRRLKNQAESNVNSLVKPIGCDEGREKIIEDEHVSHENGRVNCSVKRKREEKEEGDEFYIKGGEHAENRKRIKQLMYNFLSTYEKLSEDNRTGKKKMDRAGRFDVGAYDIMKSKHRFLRNVDKCLGCISGVDVGDVFHFRVQLLMLGLHCSTRSDIDYLTKDDKLLATSIASIHFEEFDKNAFKTDTLLFRGYGPKDSDQKLEFGNLALKNNIDAKIPIRIFRGLRKRKEATLYVYCGLYMVEKYWKKNMDGYDIFVYRLNRLPDQPRVNFEEANEFLSFLTRPGPRYSDDISRGKEKIPIRVVNAINNENLSPFKYTTSVIHSSNFYPIPKEGCDCVGGCTDSDKCACAVRNGGELPFNSEGLIVRAKPLIYECGPSCKCPPSCSNKISQNGIKFPFEVFKTEKMGWGVRSRAFIPMGSFICEFVGELLKDEEAQMRTNDDYMFAIGNNYYDEVLWEGLSSVPCLQKRAPSDGSEYDGGFSIDASIYGNFGRLINHNCTPNLYAQNVLYDHDDIRMPHIMFFACEDIPPMQELSYHYNYTIDGVHDSNGNIRKKNCYCGSIECTGRLY